jgi:hypothetical protein
LDEVDRSQVYVDIFGGRYGSGITEAEYRQARERDLPCFIYFKDEANIPADRRETDPKQADQLAALKEELRRLHTIPTFTAPDDLAAKVTADLHRWLFDEYLASQLERAVRGDIPREEAQALLVEVSGGDEQLRRALEEGVQTGHVLWLMDGLDEARGWRDKAAQQANRLPGRLIVTSRPVGYQRVDLESLPHFEILPLKPEDVDQFLRDWFGVLAEQQAFDPDWVEQRVSWLKLQLEQRPRIQPLTRNPLLLTFMVIFHRSSRVADSEPHRCLEDAVDLVSDLSCGWRGDMEPPSPKRHEVMGNPLIVVAVWWYLIVDAGLGVRIREPRFSADSNLLGSSVVSVVGDA